MDKNIKNHILFVDDERDVLDGLKRMLRDMRKEWEMSFAESGEDALEFLANTPCDVVVSDMRMPGMDGPQLLSEVLKRHPNIVRIVLSGHSDKEMILKSVGAAHQYLAKPCDAETLKAVVEQACALRDLLADDSLQGVVSQLASLPSLPTLYFELIEELKSPDSSMNRIGKIISKDVSMSAKILQLVNSAFFGMPQHVSSTSQAANLLGLDIIKTLVLSTHIFLHYKGSSKTEFPISALWDHSALTAICAKEIYKTVSHDTKAIDEAFMAGMLHDVGLLIIGTNLNEKYEQALSLLQNEEITSYDAERKAFGSSHAEVGGYLLGLWGLPQRIVEAVFFHHNPSKSSDKKFTPLTAVHIASAIEADVRQSEALTISCPVNERYLEQIGMLDHLPKWVEVCQKVLGRQEENG
ncbi:hypothetical protein MNBD_NITROSPINAE01-1578 [hydrothermal vent metagenome]|uniref:Response regulator n=1 Tax=hydrothermal vent metagenome TaxID=652676 RepID=A0A3B1BE58_9ZZZZ